MRILSAFSPYALFAWCVTIVCAATPLAIVSGFGELPNILFALAAVCALMFFGVVFIMSGSVRAAAVFVPGLALAFWGAASALLQGASDAWTGSFFEWGSIFSFAVFAFAVLSGAALPEALFSRVMKSFLFAIALVVPVLFALVVAMPEFMFYGAMWPNIGFLFVAAAIFAARCESERIGAPFRFFFGALSLSGLALFFSANAGFALLAVLAVALVRDAWSRDWTHVLPTLACAFITVAAFMAPLPELIDLPPHTSPSRLAMHAVASSSVSEGGALRALFGAGPGSYDALWEAYRPAEILSTPIGTTTQTAGSSAVGTLAAEIGLAGALLFLVSWAVACTPRAGGTAREFFEDIGASHFITLFTLVSAILFPVSLPLLLLGGLHAGAVTRGARITIHLSGAKRVLLAVLVLVSSLALGWVVSLQGYASAHHFLGIKARHAGDMERADYHAGRAADLWPNERFLSEAIVAAREHGVFALANALPLQEQEAAERAQLAFNKALTYASFALNSYPGSFAAQFASGELHAVLFLEGFSSSEDAERVLARAAKLSPSHPGIPYLLARIALRKGDTHEAAIQARHALDLMPQYSEAALLLEEARTVGDNEVGF